MVHLVSRRVVAEKVNARQASTHARSHLLQRKVWSGFDGKVLQLFLLRFLILIVALQMFSNEGARNLVMRIVMVNVAGCKGFFQTVSQSLLSRLVGSSPISLIFGRRRFLILERCPAMHSWDLRSTAPKLVIYACSLTSILVTKSLEWIVRMVRKQRLCKSLRSCWRWW